MTKRQRNLAIGALVFVFVSVWLLGSVLTPFLIGAGLAYVCDPIVDRLERLRLSRTGGVVVVFAVVVVVFTLLLLLLLPQLQQQANTLVQNLPRYVDWIQRATAPYLGGRALDIESIKTLIAENWGTAGGFASSVAKQAFSSGTALMAIAMNVLLIPVIMFYLLRDWDHMVAWIKSQLPRRYVGTITELAEETDQVLGQFIRGQLLVMTVLGSIYIVGLWLAGLDLALVIGLGAGLVSFVPYVGVISGLLVSSIAMLVQTGDPFQLVWVFIVFGIGQVLEQVILQPLLLGDAIGLHPVWVIFAVLAGGQILGFVGVLIALPVAAAVAVIVRYGGRQWRSSRAYLDH
ncbi:AI-2E family transporter [Endozoicomonas sp. G2_2]|uniref:AI-2E family transporter n=1 Tax=Endozoicomonas sp. G2_2 TaxID=2821092 RepID=UPI001ADBEB23|nr:AI-2E family transporter [Endozoicomonas sp. G2_2]MBO9469841.1 AI-2E family transporter [Endozoicomonas sp. G2_2]